MSEPMRSESPLSRRANEVQAKLAVVRQAMAAHGLGAVRLRGVDAFAWATAGASSAVLHTVEEGVAEVLVTPDDAFVLTDLIEQPRMAGEEVPEGFEVWAAPWQSPGDREAFVRAAAGSAPVASDRPRPGDVPLPGELVRARRRLVPDEIDRYRALCRDAAEAATEALSSAQPTWTEFDLAAAGAAALWRRGIHPALVLAAGEDRIPRYRHPIPTSAPLGGRAMLVFCARRHGLYANMTRFVAFRAPTADARRLDADVRAVEAEALRHTRVGARLDAVYAALVAAYARLGHGGEHLRHHQGGTTGYRAREIVASPHTTDALDADTALAWNPSLTGTKVEDTVLLTESGLDVLTVDPAWPTAPNADGLARPDVLVRP